MIPKLFQHSNTFSYRAGNHLLEARASILVFVLAFVGWCYRWNRAAALALAARTEAELLGCKNFGQTSLNEIKQQLASFGLGLRKLEE